MKRNLFLKVITGCLLVVWMTGVCLAEDLTTKEALDFAADKGEKLIVTFQEPDQQKRFDDLDRLFLTHVDTDYISNFVAGRYLKKMTSEQKRKYKDLFIRYGLAFYKTLPLDYAKDVEYDIKGAEVDGGFVMVATNIKVKTGQKVGEKQEVTLIFRLHKVDGIVKAVDVKIAESSLLLSYRNKFAEMIAQSDGEIDWFLDDFEDLVVSLERHLQQKESVN